MVLGLQPSPSLTVTRGLVKGLVLACPIAFALSCDLVSPTIIMFFSGFKTVSSKRWCFGCIWGVYGCLEACLIF